MFGIFTTIIGIASYVVFIYLGFGIVVANTISHFFAIVFAYITNKIWVFETPSFSVRIVIAEFTKFLSSRIAIYIIDTLLLMALVYVLFYGPLISRIFTSIIVVILNYIASKKIVFGKNRTGNMPIASLGKKDGY